MNRRQTLRSLLGGSLLVLCLLTARSAQAAPAIVELDIPVDTVVTAGGCPYEDVYVTGKAHLVVRFTTDAKGGVHGGFHLNHQGVSGTGLESGANYSWPLVQSGSFNVAPGGAYTETFIVSDKLIGQGPNNNSRIEVHFHITVNANGQVTAFLDSFSLACNG
jgi:hypothetical protein